MKVASHSPAALPSGDGFVPNREKSDSMALEEYSGSAEREIVVHMRGKRTAEV